MRDMNESGLIYFPYKPNELCFMIPKTNPDQEVCEFGMAIPPKSLWLGYGEKKEDYLAGGKFQIEKLLKLLKQSDYSIRSGDRILDFGCGAGRMLRWLKPHAEKCEIWGVEINSELVYWANQFLNPPFNFATSTTVPHLPFEDKYFNFIYCGSVFTHIDDFAISWLLELRRILSKDSILFITIHDYNTINEFDNNPIYKNTWIAKFMNENELYANNKFKFRMLVNGRGPASQVFYEIDSFVKSISSIFDVISVTLNAYGFQTGLLLKRK
jgi:ubiquinone/menaquinone biosynthesis C-methylase UbiE